MTYERAKALAVIRQSYFRYSPTFERAARLCLISVPDEHRSSEREAQRVVAEAYRIAEERRLQRAIDCARLSRKARVPA